MVSAVYRGDEAKPSVQTCTCVHRTCNRYGVTGDRYGVGQSHPRCDPCYTLQTPEPSPGLLVTTAKPQYRTQVQGSVITLLEVVTKVLATQNNEPLYHSTCHQ